ncbi:MAG: hypothetical protein DMD83_26550 [Candidatus Rokuibacteriota bacterium]|nr:MAG: hypothetical protein DMD83_26550 [Candidatus Rokubacteria bacterium]
MLATEHGDDSIWARMPAYARQGTRTVVITGHRTSADRYGVGRCQGVSQAPSRSRAIVRPHPGHRHQERRGEDVGALKLLAIRAGAARGS